MDKVSSMRVQSESGWITYYQRQTSIAWSVLTVDRVSPIWYWHRDVRRLIASESTCAVTQVSELQLPVALFLRLVRATHG